MLSSSEYVEIAGSIIEGALLAEYGEGGRLVRETKVYKIDVVFVGTCS